ncbi:MAG: universal stress protein [Hyphomicrobiales bacterium]
MVQSILCAADGSKIADRAVDFAIGLAKQTGASLTILTVERVSRSAAARSPFWDSNVLDAADAIVRAEFKAAHKKAQAAGLKDLRCVTAEGKNIAHAIVAYAKKNKHDHIVTGSHGHKGLQRLVLGSIAEAVVTEAHCPVTIVR